MHNAFGVRDAALLRTRALPGAASTTVNSKAIPLPKDANTHFLAECEAEVSVPAVNTTMVPDTRTQTYSLIHGNAVDADGYLTDATVLQPSVIVQTGAGGAGAAAAVYRTRLPQDVKSYVALRVVSGASTTDASAVSATLDLLF